MKMIKGFENEDIIVSDFGEWVGKNYIDYKAEYKRNQKFIEILLKENKQLKDNWEIIRQYCLDEQIPEESDEYNSYIEFSNSVYDNILNKMQELEQGSDSNE